MFLIITKKQIHIYYTEEAHKTPKTISGLTEFYKIAKLQDKTITSKYVKEFLINKYATHIHSPLLKYTYAFSPIIANNENDLLQNDLMDVLNISTKIEIYICLPMYKA